MKHVLVVDDSAVVRMALNAILTGEGNLSVAVAADPVIATRKMAERRPDVIVLDLEMPRIDGLSFLRTIMSNDPIPVVICSGIADRSSELGIRALEEGAVEIITKPKLGVRDFVEESAREIVEVVRNAMAARPRRHDAALALAQPRHSADAVLSAVSSPIALTTDKVIALAASTGGTEALRSVLQALPPDTPPVVIVQHMPEAFTTAFARRLNDQCEIEVKEAADGDRLTPGRAFLAPGNKHLVVRRSGAQYVAELRQGPPVSRHRPSADVLFRSVANAAGPNAIGVVMTGMGDDGAAGLLEMHERGAFTIAQDEATCIVFGMPKSAIERGAVDEVVGLSQIAPAVLRACRYAAPSACLGI